MREDHKSLWRMLPRRTYNALAARGLTTVSQVEQKTAQELLMLPDISWGTLAALMDAGVKLKGGFIDPPGTGKPYPRRWRVGLPPPDGEIYEVRNEAGVFTHRFVR